MGTENKYDVSVIIVTYNPEWEKLRTTIVSILLQKDINIEIIVSDDGSKNNLFKQQQEFFLQQNFINYKLVFSDENQGTIKNFLKGVEKAQGKYIKGISPGDLLYNEFTLKEWFSFMEKNNALISFGEYISYNNNNDSFKIEKTVHHPKYMKPYLYNRYDLEKEQIMYLFLRDNAVGATFLSKRKITEKYLNYISGHLKYLEDFMFFLMIVDKILIYYYPKNVIWYEYGTGISTSRNSFWSNILSEEGKLFDRLIYKQLLNKPKKNNTLKRYCNLLNYDIRNNNNSRKTKVIKKLRKLYNIIRISRGLFYYINMRFFKTYTSIYADTSFYWKCRKYK